MALWNEGDWIAAIAVVVLAAFLAVGGLVAASRKPEFMGHPKGLYMLFFARCGSASPTTACARC
jgi:POT family proton-dependent oligopeptide transporter